MVGFWFGVKIFSYIFLYIGLCLLGWCGMVVGMFESSLVDRLELAAKNNLSQEEYIELCEDAAAYIRFLRQHLHVVQYARKDV